MLNTDQKNQKMLNKLLEVSKNEKLLREVVTSFFMSYDKQTGWQEAKLNQTIQTIQDMTELPGIKGIKNADDITAEIVKSMIQMQAKVKDEYKSQRGLIGRAVDWVKPTELSPEAKQVQALLDIIKERVDKLTSLKRDGQAASGHEAGVVMDERNLNTKKAGTTHMKPAVKGLKPEELAAVLAKRAQPKDQGKGNSASRS